MNSQHLEIELRFLARDGSWKQSACKHIEQRYISVHQERVVRIRISEHDAELTIKGLRSNDRNAEYEWPIEIEKARAMFANPKLFEGSPIVKNRYSILEEGFTWKNRHLVWEVDEFLADNHPLQIAEIELKHIENGKEIAALTDLILSNLPPWIGDRLDTSIDEGLGRYNNMMLAIRPFSQWTKVEQQQMLDHLGE